MHVALMLIATGIVGIDICVGIDMENLDELEKISAKLSATLTEYIKEVHKAGLKLGWEACDNRFAACSTGEFEAPTLEEILEQVDNELKRYI